MRRCSRAQPFKCGRDFWEREREREQESERERATVSLNRPTSAGDARIANALPSAHELPSTGSCICPTGTSDLEPVWHSIMIMVVLQYYYSGNMRLKSRGSPLGGGECRLFELTATRFLTWLIHGLLGPVCAPLFRARVRAARTRALCCAQGTVDHFGINLNCRRVTADAAPTPRLPHALLRFWHS
jgi:hypothetical protein